MRITKVKFIDLRKPTNQIKRGYLEAVKKLLDGGNFVLTKEVEDFEKAWAKTLGAKYCVGTSSGADALYLAFLALGIGEGDEVITQGNAYNASVTAIIKTGARPRFVDINPDTLQMDVTKIKRLINEKTKAVLPVHLFGQANDMETISKIAQYFKLKVIEDCAQSHTACFKSRPTGLWGDIGCFSFYPTKNLGAFGDAGAVVTNDADLYEKMVAIRNLGQVTKNEHGYFGLNMRLDPIQAIGLQLKLKFLRSAISRRQKAGVYYDRLIKKFNLPLKPVKRAKYADHVYHLYAVQSLSYDRDKLRSDLKTLGVETAIHYPVPIYRQPFYHGKFDPCPVTDRTLSRILSLPMFDGIKKQEQEYVIDCLRKILKSK